MRDCEGFPKQDLHANLSVTKSVLDQSEALDRELTAGRGNLIIFGFSLPFIGSPSSLGGVHCVEGVGTNIYVHPGGALGWQYGLVGRQVK